MFSDQFVCSEKGRNYGGRGQQQTSNSYVGGTVFVDAASSAIFLYCQLSFTASETIRSKLVFEREEATVGIKVKGYNTDNGVYNSEEFTQELIKNH